MGDMHRMAAAMALASLGLVSGGYGGGSRIPRVRRETVKASGPDTPELIAEREARRQAAIERRELANQERAERKARWQAIYDPQYTVEPSREDFPSRQAYRAAVRKWQSSKGAE